MPQVQVQDSTVIAYDRSGSGPAVVVVGGGLDDGSENEPLAAELASHFTVYTYARRGRGGSGDTPPYAVEREIEDLAAVAGEAGGPVRLIGVSSGGALALEAMAAGIDATHVAVYEVPYAGDEVAAERWQAYVSELTLRLETGQRVEALELFMNLAGAPEGQIAEARVQPSWPGLVALAPTLAYDAACLGDGPPPVDRLAAIAQPVLVATGTRPDPRTGDPAPGHFDAAADALAAAMPLAERRVVAERADAPDPAVLAAEITEFMTRRR